MSNVIDTQNYINYHHQKNTLPLFLIYGIKSKILCGQAQFQKVVHHYINICRSARIYHWKEIYHEGSWKKELFLSLYFYVSHAMELLDKVRKVLRFLAECLSLWIAMRRRMIPTAWRNAWLQWLYLMRKGMAIIRLLYMLKDANGCTWYGYILFEFKF